VHLYTLIDREYVTNSRSITPISGQNTPPSRFGSLPSGFDDAPRESEGFPVHPFGELAHAGVLRTSLSDATRARIAGLRLAHPWLGLPSLQFMERICHS